MKSHILNGDNRCHVRDVSAKGVDMSGIPNIRPQKLEHALSASLRIGMRQGVGVNSSTVNLLRWDDPLMLCSLGYDIDYIMLSYSASDVRRINASILPGHAPTEEQNKLVDTCKYAGSMNIKEVKAYLDRIADHIEKKEKEREEQLKEEVGEVQNVLDNQVCPYCQSKLESMISEMTIQCTSCKEKFPFLGLYKTKWFPKKLEVD